MNYKTSDKISSDRNIVLICLDSVRKDYFDEASTAVPGLADVSFERCRAASSWSAPSYASMVSGRLPHQHGVHTHSRSFESLSIEDTVIADLGDYRSVGISANVYAGPEFGFDRYFDRFVEVASHLRFPDGEDPRRFLDERSGNILTDQATFGLAVLRSNHPLKSVANGLAGLIQKTSLAGTMPRMFDDGAKPAMRILEKELGCDEPTFAFVSLMEGHIPFEPALHLDSEMYDCPAGWSSDERGVWDLCMSEGYDDQYWTWRNQLYRATIGYLDRAIGEMIETVTEITDRETTVIVTGDHGDNLGTEADEGLANHKSSLSESLLHVPFYVVNPPKGYNSVEKEYFSHLQLRELITGMAENRTPDVFRDTVPAEVVGMSAGPEPPSDREYWDRTLRCAYRGNRKEVWDSLGAVETFALDKQRSCWQDLISSDGDIPDWATELFDVDIDTYKNRAEESAEDIEVDESTKDRLEELGYL